MSKIVPLSLTPKSNRLSLEEVASVSNYVKRILAGSPTQASDEERLQYLTRLASTPFSRERMEMSVANISDSLALSVALRRLRREVMLTLIARDVSGACCFHEVVQTTTALAEVAIQRTIAVHANELASRFGVPMSDLGVPQDLLVVGMGKLGGEELNVSSDIDLIFIYDEDGDCQATAEFPNIRKVLSNREFFEKLAKKVIPAISDLTSEGFVFRVDMRLRPNGDSGPIVASNAMLEEYLMVQGRDWERFAWLKGRVVSTNVFSSPEQFLDQKENLDSIVRPFVFRKYLDFGAISALTELHALIRSATQRKALGKASPENNVKLGRGGIREIEFIVQTFQVIRGGRNAKLRSKATLLSLQLLAEEGVISEEESLKLSQIYIFLRNVEHALQYVDDAQTQVLPEEETSQERIAKMLGFKRKELLDTLFEANEYVAQAFDAIFQTGGDEAKDEWPAGWDQGASIALSGLQGVLEASGFKQPAEGARRIIDLMNSRQLRSVNALARQRMARLVRRIVKNAQNYVQGELQVVGVDELLERFLRFLEVIAGRSTYVSLLLQYRTATQRVGRLLSASRWASDYLLKHPILLDELIDERLSNFNDYTSVDFMGWIASVRTRLAGIEDEDVESRMNFLREAHHAQVFRLLIADLDGHLSVERLADQLSALADATLTLAIEEAWKTVPNRHCEVPKFAIAAYGKLGGKELGYASDLDLVFLFDDQHPNAEVLYARFARRLLNWLTARTTSGILFEIDTRLRPNGDSGMMVSSLEAFRVYERNEDGTGAWFWEYQALTRGRFCAGDMEIGRAFEEERSYILRLPRDVKRTAEEVLKMRKKMYEGHQNRTELFDIKHDEGGMVDIEFIVQYLVLAYSHDHPELVHNFGNIKLLSMAADAGLVDREKAETTAAAYRTYRKLQHEFRLNATESQPVRVKRETLGTLPAIVKSLWADVFNQNS